MKATGIIRRIDDLGRVVIPKEIRRTLRIREGDPFEIFTDDTGSVIFKKYSLIDRMKDVAEHLCTATMKSFGMSIAITDCDAIVAASGPDRSRLVGQRLSKDVEHQLSLRQAWGHSPGCEEVYIDLDEKYRLYGIVPVIVDCEVSGAVISLKEAGSEEEYENQYMALKQVATFLENYMA